MTINSKLHLRRYVIDNSREADVPRERDYTIELSDKEHRERLQPRVGKEMEDAGFTYRDPASEDSNMTKFMKNKFDNANKLTKDTQTINLRKEDAPSKSKSIKKKSTKIDS